MSLTMTAISTHAPSMGRIKRTAALGCALLVSALAGTAQADSHLAMEKGCMNCHGSTAAASARPHMPSFEHLAAEQARHKGQPGADQNLADELREHHRVGSVTAHETLSPESALALARWIIGGAK